MLEQREAQISEVLTAAQLDPMAVVSANKKLEVCKFTYFYILQLCKSSFISQSMLNKKNTAIQDLQYELAKVCKAHDDLLRTYETKLKEYGIPKSELGFQPLRGKAVSTKVGLGPAGLVTANQ